MVRTKYIHQSVDIDKDGDHFKPLYTYTVDVYRFNYTHYHRGSAVFFHHESDFSNRTSCFGTKISSVLFHQHMQTLILHALVDRVCKLSVFMIIRLTATTWISLFPFLPLCGFWSCFLYCVAQVSDREVRMEKSISIDRLVWFLLVRMILCSGTEITNTNSYCWDLNSFDLINDITFDVCVNCSLVYMCSI